MEKFHENLSMLACIFDVSLDYLEISKERYLKFKKRKKGGRKKEFIFSQTKRITFTAWI